MSVRRSCALRSTMIPTMVVAIAIICCAPAQAVTILYVGGTTGTLGRLVPAGTFGDSADLLGGALRGDPITVVDYPASLWPLTGPSDPTLGQSISDGVDALDKAIAASSGPLVVVGTSQGAMVVQQAITQLNEDPTVPSDTTFFLIADPNLGALAPLQGTTVPGLDYTPKPLPETRFNIVVVQNQYDGFADPPTNPSNELAVLNALMGIAYVHPFAQNTNLATVPAHDVTTTQNALGGTTTTYLVPTRDLPLTMPLRRLGVPASAVDVLDAALLPVVDSGYRHIAAASTHSTTPATADVRNSRQHVAGATAQARRERVSVALSRPAIHVPDRRLSPTAGSRGGDHGVTTATHRPGQTVRRSHAVRW